MAYSEVGICNLALSHIRASSIASLSEQSEEARQCSTHYAHVRDMMLRDYPWNFARRQVSLGLLDGDAPGLWQRKYAYPSDCLYAREISPSSWVSDPVKFEVVADPDRGGRAVLTDAEEPVLIYTARITDPALFDPLFVSALSWRLAMNIAVPLTGDRQIMDTAATMYQNAISAAWRADGGEGQPDAPRDAEWIRART